MTANHCFQSALALSAAAQDAGFSLSAEAVIHITSLLIERSVDFTPPPVASWSTHEGRVMHALTNVIVMEHMNNHKKIDAIKALRQAASDMGEYCGLKEAKEAVEDHRVIAASGYNRYLA